MRPAVCGERFFRFDTDQIVEDASREHGLQPAGLFDPQLVPAGGVVVVHAGENRHRLAPVRLHPARDRERFVLAQVADVARVEPVFAIELRRLIDPAAGECECGLLRSQGRKGLQGRKGR